MSVLELRPTSYQESILGLPEEWNLMLAGGRGGAKTWAAVWLAYAHSLRYGPEASVLFVNQTHGALESVIKALHRVLTFAYRGARNGYSYNAHKHLFTLPNGATIRTDQIKTSTDYLKFQGNNVTLLVVEEFGLVSDRRNVELLKSNLRARPGFPVREVRTANPGGAQHAYVHKIFVAGGPPWEPIEVDGLTWVTCPSTLEDNPHIDRVAYERQLRAACGQDEELARAWILGDWNIARGAYFAGVLDEKVHMLARVPFGPSILEPLAARQCPREWSPSIGLDWGSSAPSVCLLGARSPGVDGYPKDSVVVLDEVAACDPTDLNVGLGWPPSKLADAVKDMTTGWGCQPQGVADDSRGLEDSLITVLRRSGVYVNRPRKQRVAGLQAVRELLTNAAAGNGRPGLWISPRCRYLWDTLPFIERDARRPEDVRTDGPDHGLDALRYLCAHLADRPRMAKTRGWF